MPPASRGIQVGIHEFVSCQRARCRHYSSIQKPRDPIPFPTQARARPNARSEGLGPKPDSIPNASASASPNLLQRLRFLLLPVNFLRQWLQSHPYVRTSLFSFIVTVPISGLVLMHFPFEPRRVTGPSMRPTMNADCESEHDAKYSPTWVLVQKWSPNEIREQQRELYKARQKGEVPTDIKSVAFRYKRGDLIVYRTPHDPEKVALKRIVGLPGDTVIPLKGYNGRDEQEPVVVPYNHLWVEGDINDRKKSVDSNYFGPISQSLIKGKVAAIWSPWWKVWGMKTPSSSEHTWPARRQNRVVEDAVETATVNPDVMAFVKGFEDEQGLKTLKRIREQPGLIRRQWGDIQVRKQIEDFWGRALVVAELHQDPATRKRALDIVEEMQRVIGEQYLHRADSTVKRQRWTPADPTHNLTDKDAQKAQEYFAEVTTHANEQEEWREARVTPAQAALKQMIKQRRKMGEVKDKEMEERDKVLGAREI